MALLSRHLKLLLSVSICCLCLLVEVARSQDACTSITLNDLGDTGTLSTTGLISDILSPGTQGGVNIVSVRVLGMNIVCEAQHEMKDRYRYTSVVVSFNCDTMDARVPECMNNTVVHTEQFDLGCVGGAWSSTILTVSNAARTTNPNATLTTDLDTNCLLCINPTHPGAGPSVDRITHCSNCTNCTMGLQHCYFDTGSMEACCTYFNKGTCVSECPSSFVPDASFECVVDGDITTRPDSINGELTVCPGDPISFTCTHTLSVSNTITQWILPGVSGTCLVAHTDNPDPPTCPPFTITMVSNSTRPTVTSTAQTMADANLNGTTVECLTDPFDPESVGIVSISVLDIPTASVSLLTQVSQSTVDVTVTVTDSQCAATYQVTATPDGGGGSVSSESTSPVVSVSGLNVCQYSYTFVGRVVTSGGVAGEMSAPVSFTADLSVLNGITVTINQEDPLMEWVQGDNPLYPTCITGYTIEDQITSRSTTVDSITRSLTAQQLNDTGFPYCTTIIVTVTPTTPMGPLETVSGNMLTSLIDPDFPIPNHFGIFSLVTEPDNITHTVTLRVSVQRGISDTVVSTRSYQYTTNGTTSSGTSFTGDSFEIELPGVDEGQEVSVTVMFENGPCQTMFTTTYTVPSRSITGVMVDVTDISATINFTLPLTEYQPGELLIISTVDSQTDRPTTANFTLPGVSTSVMFTDLTPNTEYRYTIRIALRSNNSVTIVMVSDIFTTEMMTTTPTTAEPTTVPPTSGPSNSPTTLPTPAPNTCDAVCIAIIIVVLILVVLVIVIVVVVILVIRSKKSGSMKVTSKGMEMEHKLTAPKESEPDPRYDELTTSDTFKNPEARKTPTPTSDTEGTTTNGAEKPVIYADLDLATKGSKKPAQPQVSTPSGGAAKEEEVQYATIDTAKTAKPDTEQPPAEQSSNDQPSES